MIANLNMVDLSASIGLSATVLHEVPNPIKQPYETAEKSYRIEELHTAAG
jgi:hypothetical protein